MLSVVVPRVQSDAATASVQAAVADPDAVVSVAVPLTGDDAVPKPLVETTADTVRYVADKVAVALPDAYGPPVAILQSRPIAAGRIDDRNAELRLAYLGGDAAPRVTWTQGRSPRATATALEVVGADGDAPPVEVGLTQASLDAMGAAVGDELELGGPDVLPVLARITGVFAPVDAGADAETWPWSLVPTLLEPLVVDGGDRRLAVAALLNDESLPFARYALASQSIDARYVSRPDPEELTRASAGQLAGDVRALTAAPDGVDIPGVTSTVTTRADVVVQRSVDLGAAATARAATVLLGLLAAAGALLALAASVLAQRRGATLALARSRGASRLTLAGLATAEAAVVALVGVVVAVVVTVAFARGGEGAGGAALASAWAPILVAAVLLPPVVVLVTVAAGETPPTGPGHARSRRVRQAVRAAVEVVVVALAVLGGVTLRARGDAASSGSVIADLVVLGAAPLIAGACVVVALRVAPLLRRAAIAVARRGHGAVALLAAVRGGPGPVATATIVVSVAMAVLAGASPVAVAFSEAVADGAPDPVAAPFADAALLTRTGVVAALVGIALVSVVLVGVAGRTRRDADDARARALGMTASRTTRVAVLAAAVPVAVAAAVGVAAGTLAVTLVAPGGGGGAVALGWLAVPTLAVVAAAVARARPSRRSLASRLRAG
ncbi:hypothetical protein SERN_1161 [Serinibacter arcticus]|uniref:ABC3 transporter permease protein domain-containing protein n=1 Tax=Serinibacter arcticus TaxID=1655435 RepID=A0A4Z1E609_9MICO|nr:hypothetical protein SERN_1161 [Serinibacter arcticus]